MFVSEVHNAEEDATINGYEVGVRQFLDMLPEPFNGLGYEVNYTYIDSSNPGDLAYAINNDQATNSQPLTDNPVSGLSKHNMNLAFMYEKGPWSARVAYSWRSRYLMSTNSNGTNSTYTYYDFVNSTTELRKISLPIYSAGYGQIDLGGSYRVNDHISLSVEASNVTDAIAKTLQGGYPNGALMPRSWFITDKRVSFSVRLSY